MVSKSKSTFSQASGWHWQKSLVLLVLVIWGAMLLIQTNKAFPLQLSFFPLLFNVNRFGDVNLLQVVHHWLGLLTLGLWYGVFLLCAYGLGRPLVLLIKRTSQTITPAWIYALGLGLGAMSLLSLVLGSVHLYYRGLVIPLTLTGALAGGWQWWHGRTSRLKPDFTWVRSLTMLDLSLLAIGVMVVGFALLNALAPEVFYDALVYHLAVPYHYVQHHGISVIPTNFFSNLPIGTELLYAWCLQLADERLCRLLHLTMALLTGGLLISLAQRFVSRRLALWAAVLFLTTPVVSMNMLESGVDVAAAFFGLMAFDRLLSWLEQQSASGSTDNWATIITGAFVGLALFFKYTNAFMLAPAVLISHGLRLKKEKAPFQAGFKRLLLMGLAVVAILMPLFIKNVVMTNNPVYPFLFKVIPSKFINPVKMQHQMDEFKEFGKRTWTQLISQPWTLTFYQATSNSFIGVVYLFMLPGLMILGVYRRRGPPSWQLMFWTIILGSLIWTSQTQIMRYYIPLLPVLCLLIVILLERWQQWHMLSGTLVKAGVVVLTLWGSLTFMGIGVANWDPVGVTLGLESRAAYLNRKLMNSYAVMADAVNQLPSRSRILIYGDSRSFYYKRDVTTATVFNDHPLIKALSQHQSAEQIWRSWRAQGYTHFLVFHGEAQRLRGYESYQWDDQALSTYQVLTSRYMVPVKIYQQQILYRLEDQPVLQLPVKAGQPLFTVAMDILQQVQVLLNATARQQDPSQEMSQWKKIQTLVPGWWVPYQVLGWYHAQRRDMAEAYRLYARADALGWLNPQGYYFLGIMDARSGHYALAASYLQAALAQAPGFTAAQQALNQIREMTPGLK